MPYLILNDYYPTIQDVALQQILTGIDSYRLIKQQTALDEIKTYLVQKYDVSDEFRDTVLFSFSSTYKAKQLVYLNASAYSAASTYALNAITLYLGNVYYCSTAIVLAEAWTIAHWTLLGAQYELFYIPVPYDEFNYKAYYSVGDRIFWKDKVYQCLKPSAQNTQNSSLQYERVSDIPYVNQFPDATNQNQWSASSVYSFSGLWPVAVPGDFTAWSSVTVYTTGNRVSFDSIIWQAQANSTNVSPDSDITKWLPVSYILGDNRNSQLVELNTHIAIYKLSTRISPRNIPEIWVKNYDDAIMWLKMCAKGTVTLDAPLLQPNVGKRVRWGGEPRRINDY